jgi:hypothetical protein
VADRDAAWLSRAASEAILLCDGRIEAAGNVGELMSSVDAMNRIEILLEEEDFTAIPDISGVEDFDCQGKRIVARVRAEPHLPGELLGWITRRGGRVRSMEVRSATLYEALLREAGKQESGVTGCKERPLGEQVRP